MTPKQQVFNSSLNRVRDRLSSEASPLFLAVKKYDEATALHRMLCAESSTHEAALINFSEQYQQKREVLNYPRDGWLMRVIKFIADIISFRQFSEKLYRTHSHCFTEIADSALDYLNLEIVVPANY